MDLQRRSPGPRAHNRPRPHEGEDNAGDNGVFVVLQDTLTRGEQSLADAGERRLVLDLRRRS
jgi:hypothetical protein